MNCQCCIARMFYSWVVVCLAYPQFGEADERFPVACCGDSIVVPVTVSGKEFRFLIDTSSGTTSVDTSLAEMLGKPTRTIQTLDGTELHPTFFYAAPNIRIGGVVPKIDEVLVWDMRRLRKGVGYEMSGAVGIDVLKQLRWSIDFDAGEFRVHDRNKPLVDNESTRKKCVVTTNPNTVLIFNSIPGSVTDDSVPFMIHTGLGSSLTLNEEIFDRLVNAKIITNLRKEHASTAFVQREFVVGNIQNFRFAGQSHPSLKCIRMKVNLIGLPFLARYRVTFDLPNEEIWFRPGKQINKRDPIVNSGIGVEYDDIHHVLIRVVDKSSVAEAAGIRIDDQLLEIDGQPVVKFSLFQIRERFAMPGDFRMKILRAGKTLNFQFRLEADDQ